MITRYNSNAHAHRDMGAGVALLQRRERVAQQHERVDPLKRVLAVTLGERHLEALRRLRVITEPPVSAAHRSLTSALDGGGKGQRACVQHGR